GVEPQDLVRSDGCAIAISRNQRVTRSWRYGSGRAIEADKQFAAVRRAVHLVGEGILPASIYGAGQWRARGRQRPDAITTTTQVAAAGINAVDREHTRSHDFGNIGIARVKVRKRIRIRET